MNVRMLKVFGTGLPLSEIAMAAEAAAKTLNCKRFSLPIADGVYGRGFEILLFDNRAHELCDNDNDIFDDELPEDMR